VFGRLEKHPASFRRRLSRQAQSTGGLANWLLRHTVEILCPYRLDDNEELQVKGTVQRLTDVKAIVQGSRK
jgi:myo-inositol catabolism protein IolC